MPRPKSPPRVKFYEESMSGGRVRYRVRLIENGQMDDATFWNLSEAATYRTSLEDALLKRSGRSIGEALDAYYAEKVELGTVRQKTCEREKPRVCKVLAPFLDRSLTSINAEQADSLYKTLVRQPNERTGVPLAPASHRHDLKLTRSFFQWCVRKRYLSVNPFADVRPVGRVNRGKPQLRAEEVSRFIAAGLKRFGDRDDRLAMAAVMLPIFGLRAGEALSRRVRDIDRGRVWRLVIDAGLDDAEGDLLKNENARRVLEIPSILIPHLTRLVDGRGPTEYLFGPSTRTGKRKSNQSLWSAVTQICDEAGVPRVCPHSMRGFYASAGVSSGVLPHVVAANMGHSSFAITAQHYASPEAITQAHSTRVFELLDLEQSAAVLSQLSAEQIIAQISLATLVRIVEIAITGIRTEPLPVHAKPAISRDKN